MGQTLTLALIRTGGTDGTGGHPSLSSQNIAVDDIVFDQLPATALPAGPQVVSVAPADAETGVAAVYSYRASISNGDTELAAGSIQLKLDGSPVVPPPTISSVGDLTNVSFQAPGLLASGSTHTYTLTYDDTSVPAATYTKDVRFTVFNYPTLPASYANPAGSATNPGFICRTALAPPGTPALDATIARAKAQLNGTLIDPSTQLPLENVAEIGPNPDGSFNVDTVLDFDDDGAVSGNFMQETPFPGLSIGGNNEFATEAWFYLDLPAGYHRFGVNSDDGFEVSVGTPAQGEFTAQTRLGFFDTGRAADDTVFDFLVTNAGIYRFRLIVFESAGAASCEFFSVNLATGEKILINDLTQPNAIRSYRSLSLSPPPRITSVTRSGSDLVIQWVDGTPPFQVEFSSTLRTGGWSDLGPPTSNRTATIPMQGGSGFVRVAGQ